MGKIADLSEKLLAQGDYGQYQGLLQNNLLDGTRLEDLREWIEAPFHYIVDHDLTNRDILSAGADVILSLFEKDYPYVFPQDEFLYDLGLMLYRLRDSRSALRIFTTVRQMTPNFPAIEESIEGARKWVSLGMQRATTPWEDRVHQVCLQITSELPTEELAIV